MSFDVRQAVRRRQVGGKRRTLLLAFLAALLTSPASADLGPHPGFVSLGGRLYFSSEPATGNEQLFSYNPANGSQTSLTTFSLAPSAGVVVVGRLASFNGQVVFAGRGSASTGLEPWRFDPATSTATILGDLNAGAADSNPSGFTELGGKLYFAASDANGGQIWVYDPANGTTTRKTSINSGSGGSSPSSLTAFNGRLYFSAYDVGPGVLRNCELWEFDPSNDAVTRFEINGNSGGVYDGSSFPTNLTPFNGKLYMQAMVSTSVSGRNNRELVAFDPSPRTVALVKELNPAGDAGGDPTEFTVVGSKLYFAASDGSNTRLWVFIPGDATTPKVLGSTTGVANLKAATFDGQLYFTATGQLWSLDPSNDTSTSRANLAGANLPSNLFEATGKLYLTLSDATYNNTLVEFDPATNGVTTLYSGTGNPTSLALLNDALFLIANNGSVRQLTALPILTPVASGHLAIDEFRLSGPNGAEDEYVEIYNTDDVALVVRAVDGSGGFGLAASDGVVRFTVPNGVSIPGRGHFLGANNTATTGYSLGTTYPAGAGFAVANATYTQDIPPDSGLALFNTSNPANLTLANRLDAVGFTNTGNALYVEGSGIAPVGATTSQHSFLRQLTSGLPADTNVNSNDFVLVSTNAGMVGTVQSRLGAPAPKNSSSPIQSNGSIPDSLVEPTLTGNQPPNRVRDLTPVPGFSKGTLEFRRRYTNNTGGTVSRLRFRIVNMTTLQSPGYTPGVAQSDLRMISGPNISFAATTIGVSGAKGLTLELPSLDAPGVGGGWNATASVNLPGSLPNGATIDVNFRLALARAGTFQFFVNVEALP